MSQPAKRLVCQAPSMTRLLPPAKTKKSRIAWTNTTWILTISTQGSVFKNSRSPPHLALPYRCTLHAPREINVYTDGSWVHPLKQFLGLGGAGVWWPGRNPSIQHRLSQAETDLAYYKQFPEGTMLFTPIGGYHGSSTRTELAAAIVAIMANGPIHIGTDSQAFMDTAIDILFLLRANKSVNYNWKTMVDGDLLVLKLVNKVQGCGFCSTLHIRNEPNLSKRMPPWRNRYSHYPPRERV